ncbi:MAG: hypothetical protein WAZ18_04890 [Alphaproteobacteria bacterium]
MLRLISLATTAIAGLYALEMAGIVPERAYFPTLPRLEQSDNTPANWASAAGWGVQHLPNLAAAANLPSAFNLPAASDTPSKGTFTHRVAAKHKPAAKS